MTVTSHGPARVSVIHQRRSLTLLDDDMAPVMDTILHRLVIPLTHPLANIHTSTNLVLIVPLVPCTFTLVLILFLFGV